MNKFVRFASVMAAAVALSAASQASAAGVVNGNFETGPFGGTPTGFTVSPGGEIVAVQASAYVPCCGVTGTAAELANHFAAFGGGELTNISTLDQIIRTAEGDRLHISFDFGALGGGFQTLFASAYEADGNRLLASFQVTRSADNNLSTTFGRYSFDAIAASSITRLSFSVDGPSAGVDGILDNIAVAVPEPASWALMIAGFGVVGGALRRRRPARVITLA